MEVQNGFSPGRGTIDGSFCVRTMLKKRKEHGLETWAYFLDLVKAFDTVPREALIQVLDKFGVPPKMVSMIRRMLKDNIVKLQVQKQSNDMKGVMREQDAIINSTAGVPQGNSMSPVLFVIYIQAVLETMDTAFTEAGSVRDKPLFYTKLDHMIHGREWNAKRGRIGFSIAEALYADDACFAFGSRESMCEAAVIVDKHFTDFGLKVHKGKDGKKSKTECMFFPPSGFKYEDADTSSVEVNNGYYTFCKRFKYLGSIITWDLKADDDVKTRIRCATSAFNLMRNVLKSKLVKASRKAQLYKVIVCTVLLYGSECWAMRADLLQRLERFHNQCIRGMCNITRREQWHKHISDSDLREKFKTINRRKSDGKNNILKPLGTIEDMLTERNLRWGGHVARMKPDRMPRLLLTAWVNNKRPIGRPEQTFGHALKRSLVLRAKQIEKSFTPEEMIYTRKTSEIVEALRRTGYIYKKDRNKETWLDLAQDRKLWTSLVYELFHDRNDR